MRIFISYRRDDSADVTGRIYDRLLDKFGRNSIYRDVDVIPFGVDFATHIEQALLNCDVFLAVIGPRWATITGKSGKPRLEEPNDFVRQEVETALKRNIPVIPLFIGGVTGLDTNQLPPSLKGLAFRNGIAVRGDPDFHKDVDRLIKHLRRRKRTAAEAGWAHTPPALQKAIKYLQGRLRWYYVVPLALMCLLGGGYLSATANLPSVEDLRNHVSQFETTRILDREGNILAEIVDPNAGRRTYVTLDKVSPVMVAATLAVEDPTFYSNPGFNLWTTLRSLWGEPSAAQPADTITQKLVSRLLLSAEEREHKSVRKSLREMVLAAEITRRYSKDDILEIYLSELYYGNSAYGVEAAAETYFGKTANQLTLTEAAFLAGLPLSPSEYDIYSNREAALARQQQVLVLMYGLSQQRGCIAVSNSETPVCVDQTAAVNAADELRIITPTPAQDVRYPHWVQYIRTQLEASYDPQTLYRSGFIVYTTLDPDLQQDAQQVVSQHVAALADKNLKNGALVAIKPSTGEILASIGAADIGDNPDDGQPDYPTPSNRNPGSLLQPIIYLAAFEKGWTPATWIADDPSALPTGGQSYPLENFDQAFHGNVTIRTALANSYNIPAIKTIQFASLYDQGVLALAERLGIHSLTRTDYDLSLPVDGGEVGLLEMTNAFSAFADLGRQAPPLSILKIIDYTGNVIYEARLPRSESVIRPEHAYLVTSILSDNQARVPTFGTNSILNLTFPAAVTTGTTYDHRDAWTIGYTPDIVVGVWVGNLDQTKMIDVTGRTGAAPIWAAFLIRTVDQMAGGNSTSFPIPDGIATKSVCAVYVTESQVCPALRDEVFASDQMP